MIENKYKIEVLSQNGIIAKKFKVGKKPKFDHFCLLKPTNEVFMEDKDYKPGDIYSIKGNINEPKSYVLILSNSFKCSALLVAPIITRDINFKYEKTLLIPIGYIPEINKYKFCFINTNFLQIVSVNNLNSYVDFNENYIKKLPTVEAKRILKDVGKKWLGK